MRSRAFLTLAVALALAGCGATTVVDTATTATALSEAFGTASLPDTSGAAAEAAPPDSAPAGGPDGPAPRPAPPAPAGPGGMTLDTTLSEQAQATTIAFDALAFMTGNLCADSFFPPGKVADYFGFQYLRDNDATGLGHNTAFAGTVGETVLSVLSDEQAQLLASLAEAQVDDIADYALARFPLMAALRRLLDDDLPEAATGLSTPAVEAYSAEVYTLDGRISLERAETYAQILSSLSPAQEERLAALAATGMADWPDLRHDTGTAVWREQLTPEEHVAFITYAGDLFAWYVGDVESDTYFCPERHGTYFGSFYMKDTPAMLAQQAGNDVSINENLTGDYGDRFLALLTAEQRATIEGLVSRQQSALEELVEIRRAIAEQLRSLWDGSGADAADVEQTVMGLSAQYGELDGQVVALYAAAFDAVYESLTPEQLATLWDLRGGEGNLNLNAAFGDPCSLTPNDLAYLYSQTIDMPEMGDTDFLFE